MAEVEIRAFRLAELRLGDTDQAHDAVQDAMFRLVRKYAHKPEAEWRPLFFRILGNRILDMQRAATLRRWLFLDNADPERSDLIATTAGPSAQEPEQRAKDEDFWWVFGQVLRDMPPRQQETVVYRLLEGMDVAETARHMGCSPGSVKTQYARGMARLRTRFGDRWDP
nr:sigma-70 family RNA polymerase sigma factor [Natronospira proteinivora]